MSASGSLIITSYNRDRYLTCAIESVLTQTYHTSSYWLGMTAQAIAQSQLERQSHLKNGDCSAPNQSASHRPDDTNSRCDPGHPTLQPLLFSCAKSKALLLRETRMIQIVRHQTALRHNRDFYALVQTIEKVVKKDTINTSPVAYLNRSVTKTRYLLVCVIPINQ